MAYSFSGQIDPGMYIGLQSMDFGEVTSPDGRSHSVDAHTPVQVVSANDVTSGNQGQPTLADPTTGATIAGASLTNASNPITDLAAKLADKALGAHWLARSVFVLIGVALIIIVAARLTLAE